MVDTKVSFIIPVKDRPNELKACLASCLTQTYKNWEAVVVDDHSSCNIWAIVEMLADTRIKYIKQARNKKGIAEARQTAISHSTGDIFVTLDSDDLNKPERAYQCVSLLQTHMPEMIYTRVCFFDHETGAVNNKPLFVEHNSGLLEKFNYITNPGTAFTRLAYEKAGGHYDTTLEVAEDYELYLRMQRAGVRIKAVDEQHVYYRKNIESATYRTSEIQSNAIHQIRVKHGVKPFSLRDLKESAPPELWKAISTSQEMRRIWIDRRCEASIMDLHVDTNKPQ